MIGTHPILVNLLRRILDAELVLQGMAAANLHAPSTEHGAATDIEVLVDKDDRRTVVTRTDGRRQSGGSGADHDHIGRMIPADGVGGLAAHCGRHY